MRRSRQGSRGDIHRRLDPAGAGAHRGVEPVVRAAALDQLQHSQGPNAKRTVAGGQRRARSRPSEGIDASNVPSVFRH